MRIEALAVAEAERDLYRIKRVRTAILRNVLAQLGPLFESPSGLAAPAEQVIAATLGVVAEDLMRLERYERRTRSRRKFAMRRLYHAKLAKIDPNAEARLAAMKHEAWLLKNHNNIEKL